jgi:Ca-activated chloride channel homolog
MEKEDPLANWVDIVIVLDLSKSMLAEDIKPNRIESAKQAIVQFVQSTNQNRIWLVWFAWKPFVFSPLTFDTTWLTSIVQKISVDSIRQEISWLSGTAIWDGLLLATSTLEPEPERKKIILLLTDGEANVWTDPRSTLRLIKEFGTTIYSIGIWNPSGTELYTTNGFGEKEYFTDANGVPIRATLDEELMTLLSEQTGGKYVNIQSKSELITALWEISKIYSQPIKAPKLLIYESRAGWIIWGITFLLFLLLVIEQFDARSAFRVLPYIAQIPIERFRNISSVILTRSANYRINKWPLKLKVLFLILTLVGWYLSLALQIPEIPPEKTLFLMDISKSMNVRDISHTSKEISRIEAAKEIARHLVWWMEKTPVSIMLFGNTPRLEIPYTTDKTELLRSIETITPGDLPGKTNISWALQEALIHLWKENSGQIILFTDGEDTNIWDTNKIYPAANQRIHVFAIGTSKWGEIPIWTDAFWNEYIKSVNGKPIISKVNNQTLRSLLPNSSIIEVDTLFDIPKSTIVLTKNMMHGIGNSEGNWRIFLSTLCWIGLILFISLPYRSNTKLTKS